MLSKYSQILSAQGIQLNQNNIDSINIYVDELLRWNKKINLTAIVDVDEIYEKHVFDCLRVLPLIKRIKSIVDIGSGAGLPGLLLALMRPDLQVLSVESVGKKINFQKQIKRKLNLDNFNTYNDRAEKLITAADRYDAVISRAFSSLDTFLNLSWPLLNESGTIIAMKGPEGSVELKALQSGNLIPEDLSIDVENYSLPFSRSLRSFVIFSK